MDAKKGLMDALAEVVFESMVREIFEAAADALSAEGLHRACQLDFEKPFMEIPLSDMDEARVSLLVRLIELELVPKIPSAIHTSYVIIKNTQNYLWFGTPLPEKYDEFHIDLSEYRTRFLSSPYVQKSTEKTVTKE